MAKVINSTEVISNSVRWTNVHVFKPTSIRGSKPRYSTTLIIPKSDIETISKVQSALQDAYEDLQRFDDSTPDFSKIKNPLQDGDICFKGFRLFPRPFLRNPAPAGAFPAPDP